MTDKQVDRNVDNQIETTHKRTKREINELMIRETFLKEVTFVLFEESWIFHWIFPGE